MNNDQPQNNTTPNNTASAPGAPATSTPAPAAQAVASSTTWPGAFGIYKTSKQAVMLNIGTILVLVIANSIIQGISNNRYENAGLEFLISIVALFVSVVYTTTLAIVWFAGIKNQKISLSETFNKSKPYLIRILLSSLLVGLACIASILLFLIPFFFVFPRLLFTPFLVIDKNMGAVDAFSASWAMSKGHMGKIYGVIGATLAMLLLSLTIIGIPFSIYFIIMYSAAFTLLYTHINTVQPVAAVPANTPATPAPQAPIESTPAPQAPTADSTTAAETAPQPAATEPPTAPKV